MRGNLHSSVSQPKTPRNAVRELNLVGTCRMLSKIWANIRTNSRVEKLAHFNDFGVARTY